MSNFTTIYDRMRVEIAAHFSSARELPNPENLEENADQILNNGYGIIVGPATVLTDFDNTEYYEEREFQIVFTRVIKTTDNNVAPLVTAKKNLIEDTVTLKKDWLNADQLTVDSSVQTVKLGDSSGIEFITNKPNFIKTTIKFIVGISESII